MSDDGLRFTAQEFSTLMDWFMVSDPWPLSELKHDHMREMLDDEARRRGYDGWIQAYHEFEIGEVDS